MGSMTERPIILAAPHVRAVLAGRKTQHRVVLKPCPPRWCGFGRPRTLADAGVRFASGDRLWVRETYGLVWPHWCDDGRVYDGENWEYGRSIRPEECTVEYRVDLHPACTDGPGSWPRGEADGPKWRSAATMPRWASRITLAVTDVRIERLNEISEADAVAEGAIRYVPCQSTVAGRALNPSEMWCFAQEPVTGERVADALTARDAFELFWDSLHKPGEHWADNPWCVVLGIQRDGER